MTLLSLAIDVIPAGIAAALIVALLGKRMFGTWKRRCACALFAVYLLAVYSLTGIPSVTNLTVDLGFNFVPLAGMAGDAKNTALNVLLFVPLGWFLPLLWKEFRSLSRAVLCGLALSLAIEILQIFTFRLTDVNDLIANTAGALVGYLLAKPLLKSGFGGEGRPAAPELPLLLGLTFALAFLAQPFISSALWNVIYK